MPDWLKSPILPSRKNSDESASLREGKCRGALKSDLKSVSPVNEFQMEPFTVSHGHLFCNVLSC